MQKYVDWCKMGIDFVIASHMDCARFDDVWSSKFLQLKFDLWLRSDKIARKGRFFVVKPRNIEEFGIYDCCCFSELSSLVFFGY